ncbi:MAG: c-type cytochrome [Salibacteraceae bacterium]
MRSLTRQSSGTGKWLKCFLFFILFIATPFYLLAEPPAGATEAQGEGLFNAKCKSCHYLTAQKNTGPGLYGYRERVPNEEWLYKWIRNPQGMIKSGDAYANELWAAYKPTLMTAFGTLTDVEIGSILIYLDNNTVQAEEVVAKDPKPTGGGDPQEGESDATSLIIWLGALALVFYVVIKVLGLVKTSLINLDRTGKGLKPKEDISHIRSAINWLANNKKYAALIVLVIVSVGATNGWYALKGVAVYQGYAPEQPIKFSHKIHAGQNAVECVYCHHAAE